jgi:hypothetical protein
MANEYANLGTVSPEIYQQQQDLNRQQRMAEMLMQNNQQPQGQMISGRFVAPSWAAQLAPVVSTLAGSYLASKGDEKAMKLANTIRQEKMGVLENLNQALDTGDLKTARSIASANPEYAKEFIAPLIANAIPKQQESKVVGNTLVGPDGKPIYTAPKEFAPHAPQMVSTDQGMMIFDPNSKSYTPAMSGGKPIMPPMESGAKNDLRDISKQQSIVAGAMDAVKNTPTAFGYKRGASGAILVESLSNRMETPAETEARSYVFNIVSKVIHDRAGASQTPSEIAKINRFLPNEFDNADAIQRKLKGFQTFLADEAKGVRTPFNPQANVNPPPAANPNRKIVREGTVQDGVNKNKRAIEYSDGTIEYK